MRSGKGEKVFQQALNVPGERPPVLLAEPLFDNPILVDAKTDLTFQHLLVVGDDDLHQDIFFPRTDEFGKGLVRFVGGNPPRLHDGQDPRAERTSQDLLPGGPEADDQIRGIVSACMDLLFDNLTARHLAEERHQLPLFRRLLNNLHAGDVVDHEDLSVTRNRPFGTQIVQQPVFRPQELLRHVRGRRQEPLPRDAEETRPLIRQGFGMPFDRVEDPVDDPAGRFLRKTPDAFDPA